MNKPMSDENELDIDPGVPAPTEAADEPAPTEPVSAEAGDASAPADAADDPIAAAPPADAAPLDETPGGPSAEVRAVVEALIFASPEPISARALCRMIAEEPKEDV